MDIEYMKDTCASCGMLANALELFENDGICDDCLNQEFEEEREDDKPF